MEIKRKRYLFSLVLSAFMILMIFALYKPLEVQAARTMPHKSEGYIYVKKGNVSGSAGYYYFQASSGKIKKTGGLSYNKKTNISSLIPRADNLSNVESVVKIRAICWGKSIDSVHPTSRTPVAAAMVNQRQRNIRSYFSAP